MVAINRRSIIWKSDLTDKIKRSFFQAAVTSMLLNGCTTWTLTKRLMKKLDGNYTRILRAILNKSWRQHPTIHQLYDHLPPITKTIQVRRTRHAGHCWRSKGELISDVLLGNRHHMAVQKPDGQHEHTFSNYVRIQDFVLNTCLRRWTIGKSGERGSGISVLPAEHDEDDIYFSYCISINLSIYTSQSVLSLSLSYSLSPSLPPSLSPSLSLYIYIYIYIYVGNGHSDMSSKPGRDWLHFT